MGVPIFRKTLLASGSIAAKTFVIAATGGLGSTGYVVAQAVDASRPIVGVCDAIALTDTQQGDFILAGIADVVFGGTVAFGDRVTADSTGKAVAHGTTAGTNYEVAGIALRAQVSGDIGPVLLGPCRIQG
jgi:hypothetical protein